LFNNREIATAIWLTPFVVWILTKSKIRASLADVARAFLAWKVLASFAALALYTAALIFALYAVGFWQLKMTKDTVEWFFFTASAMITRFATSRKKDNIIRDVVTDNVKIIIIIEFILKTYVMSLFAELVVVPSVTFLTLMMAVTQLDEKQAPVARVSKFLLGAVGFVVLGFAISRAIGDYQSFGTRDTLRGITFPPLMSISLIPFIYVLIVITIYDEIFIRLTVGREKTPAVVRYAKRRIFSHCGLSFRRLRDLESHPEEIMQIASNEDVDRLLTLKNPVSPS